MTRLLSKTPGREADKQNARDEWGKTHGSGIWLTGRTVLNMWRIMRSELKLCSYTLQVRVDSIASVNVIGNRSALCISFCCTPFSYFFDIQQTISRNLQYSCFDALISATIAYTQLYSNLDIPVLHEQSHIHLIPTKPLVVFVKHSV